MNKGNLKVAEYDQSSSSSDDAGWGIFAVTEGMTIGSEHNGLVGDTGLSSSLTVNVGSVTKPVVVLIRTAGTITFQPLAGSGISFVQGSTVVATAAGDVISIIPTLNPTILFVKKG